MSETIFLNEDRNTKRILLDCKFFASGRFLERVNGAIRFWVFIVERYLFGERLASDGDVVLHF